MTLEENQEPTRRSFLSRLVLWIGGLGVGGSILVALRSLVPNVLYEPSKKVKIGTPEMVPDGVTFYRDARAFVFKKGEGGKAKFYAISATCTHLGCIVQHVEKEKQGPVSTKEPQVGFACPCHGSKFTINGDVIQGPAPKPLPWLALAVSADDGQIVVDTATTVDKNEGLLVWAPSQCKVKRV